MQSASSGSAMGYYQFPDVHGDAVAFVCQGKLWMNRNGRSWTLPVTAGDGEAAGPKFSPDGKRIAFSVKDGQAAEIYVASIEEGSAVQLTWQSAEGRVLGWSPDGQRILYSSDAAQPFNEVREVWSVPAIGGSWRKEAEPHPFRAAGLAFHPSVGWIASDFSSSHQGWKGYRGGMKGRLWIRDERTCRFKLFLERAGSIWCPMAIGGRAYWISDMDGFDGIYSCGLDGSEVRLETGGAESRIRYASSDGRAIVFESHGEIHRWEPASPASRVLDVKVSDSGAHLRPQPAPVAGNIEDFSAHPCEHSLLATVRGKVFSMFHREGPARMLDFTGDARTRYRFVGWCGADDKFVGVRSDESGRDFAFLATQREDGTFLSREIDPGVGIITALESSGSTASAAANLRNELYYLDFEKGAARRIDVSGFGPIAEFDLSRDGRYVCYSIRTGPDTSAIKVFDARTGSAASLTSGHFLDRCPRFDPNGLFLYFLSDRGVEPIDDDVTSGFSFPVSSNVFALPLRRGIRSPFTKSVRQFFLRDQGVPPEKDGAIRFGIDLDGAEDRILKFPTPYGRHQRLRCTESHVFFLNTSGASETRLEAFNFETQKHETIAHGIIDYRLAESPLNSCFVREKKGIRVIDCGRGHEKEDAHSGYVDLARIKSSPVPSTEWRQMLREAWGWQKELHCSALAEAEWTALLTRFESQLDRIRTRSEFSSLLREMLRQLGTSHANEIPRRRPAAAPNGFLGLDFEERSGADAGLFVRRLLAGDPWTPAEAAPVAAAELEPGDALLSINGGATRTLVDAARFLRGAGNAAAALKFKRMRDGAIVSMTANILADESALRRRDWVKRTQAGIESAFQGTVGYIHLGNMKRSGFSEFNRYYRAYHRRRALVIDLRYNEGGYCSHEIFNMLVRTAAARIESKKMIVETFPHKAAPTNLVLLVNESTSSDAEVLARSMRGLPGVRVVGSRTWGGVVGMRGSHSFVDGGLTTQPQFVFKFGDDGEQIEGLGMVPDALIPFMPDDSLVDGRDPQLQAAVDILRERLK